jgi:hypothetical protein
VKCVQVLSACVRTYLVEQNSLLYATVQYRQTDRQTDRQTVTVKTGFLPIL